MHSAVSKLIVNLCSVQWCRFCRFAWKKTTRDYILQMFLFLFKEQVKYLHNEAGKGIQKKLDGLGTFEGEQAEIGTFLQLLLLLDPDLYAYKVPNCCKLCSFAIYVNFWVLYDTYIAIYYFSWVWPRNFYRRFHLISAGCMRSHLPCSHFSKNMWWQKCTTFLWLRIIKHL